MPLTSSLFKYDPRLQACLVSDPAHLTVGVCGDHVSKVQTALVVLDGARIGFDELTAGRYGAATAIAVLDYKTKRNIVNTTYQSSPDNIVGKMTIARLDEEMARLEEKGKNLNANRTTFHGIDEADYANSYRLQKCLLASIWGRPRTVTGMSFADRAIDYRETFRTLQYQGGIMVKPYPGFLREQICQRGLIYGSQFGGRSLYDKDDAPDNGPNGGSHGRSLRDIWKCTVSYAPDNKRHEAPTSRKDSWCGMFATWIWRRAGLNVEWVFSNQARGNSNGPYIYQQLTRIRTSTEREMICPGDIIFGLGSSNHHVLVLEIHSDGNQALIVEGNGNGGKVHIRTALIPPAGGYWGFYSVDSYRDQSVNYGTNIQGGALA